MLHIFLIVFARCSSSAWRQGTQHWCTLVANTCEVMTLNFRSLSHWLPQWPIILLPRCSPACMHVFCKTIGSCSCPNWAFHVSFSLPGQDISRFTSTCILHAGHMFRFERPTVRLHYQDSNTAPSVWKATAPRVARKVYTWYHFPCRWPQITW